MPEPTLPRPRHLGKALYFFCIDDFFFQYVARRREELNQPFGVNMGGGGLAFLLKDSQNAACIQVATSCVISGTGVIYLASHLDCGAYKYLAGVDLSQVPEQVQVATLWRDLHVAERVACDFLGHFKNPLDSGWKPPQVTFVLEVVNLQEQLVPEPVSLSTALPFNRYRNISIPSDL